MTEIGRLLTAMVTPFRADGSVDYEQAGELAKALLASGSDGIVLTGTTGETPTLSIEEQVEVWRSVRRAVGPDAMLVGGASTNSTSESLEMVTQGVDAGMSALMFTVPYYNKPPQEGLFRHFRTLAEATPLPCILYNIPGRTSLNMTAETTLRLAREVPNIVGIKEASGDMEQIGIILDGAPAGFKVWAGDDSAAVNIVERGGWGVISVASHLVGRQISEMLAAAAAGQIEEARRLEAGLMPLFNVLFIETNPIPVKFALNHVGFRVGGLRLPMIEASEAAQAKVSAELAKHQVDLPIPV
ncbi:MAG TPA: 4-hydroxy-tetrahydrodipicolinate synthase [Dehalococcoidia bacterium]|nr:4-hydroxy-tetrahydrodipicolinate synthase [Dehalococcoidia bacterium]